LSGWESIEEKVFVIDYKRADHSDKYLVGVADIVTKFIIVGQLIAGFIEIMRLKQSE
tara:strand:- start:496 stop:666 length:171 start_codon:yes stop_codon:yes gene_type:complete